MQPPRFRIRFRCFWAASLAALSVCTGGGVFAFVTLQGGGGTDPEQLREFLRRRGHGVRTVHRVTQVHSSRVVVPEEAPCEADALAWKHEAEHREARRLGRERWYSSFSVHVATVQRTYSQP